MTVVGLSVGLFFIASTYTCLPYGVINIPKCFASLAIGLHESLCSFLLVYIVRILLASIGPHLYGLGSSKADSLEPVSHRGIEPAFDSADAKAKIA